MMYGMMAFDGLDGRRRGSGRNLVTKDQIHSELLRISGLMRDGTAEPVSRGQFLGRERGQGNIYVSCLADHEQDWQTYPVDPYSAESADKIYVHTFSCCSLSVDYCLNSQGVCGPYIITVTTQTKTTVLHDTAVAIMLLKNLNASRPSEHPSV